MEGQLPRKLSALLQSLVLVRSSCVAPENHAFVGGHEEELSWVTGTCPTKSSGNSDGLLEAVLVFTEESIVRAEIGVMRSWGAVVGNWDIAF